MVQHPQAESARISGKDMFLKEARKMSRVREIPQVVHIRDLFQENDTAYIVMDFVDGLTLKNHLQKTGILTWEQAKSIFFPAIQAMEQVHRAGLIHRDLSPDNLMLMPDGSVRILDLGAAKDLNVNSGASSMQVAKGGFSPLEQYTQRGGSGTWTDVYSMAATLYYSLTGVVPPAVMDRMEEDTIRWDLQALQALPRNALSALRNAMAIFPKERIQTMAEFYEQLQPVSAPLPPYPPDPPLPPVNPNKKKVLLAAVAAALVVVVGATVLLLPKKSSPREEIQAAANTSTKEASSLPTLPEESPLPKDRLRYTDSQPADFDDDSRYTQLILGGAQDTYTYRDGSTIKLYFDSKEQERCRVYLDSSGQRQMVCAAEYTEDGSIAEQRTYDGSGALQHLIVYQRDDNGNLLERANYDGSCKLVELQKWTYTADGQDLSSIRWNASGEVVFSSGYSYSEDNQGHTISTQVTLSGTTTEYLYNKDGNLVKYTNYDEDGHETYRATYTYDPQGWQLTWTYYENGSSNPSYSEECVYENDRRIQRIWHSYYGGRHTVTTWDILYVAKDIEVGERSSSQLEEYVADIIGNRKTTTTYYLNSEYSSHSVDTYDWFGNLSRNEYYDGDGVLSSYSVYHYDASHTQTGYTFTYLSSYDGSRTVTEYDADYDPQTRHEYDASGALTERSEYTYDGSTCWKKVYDSQGNLQETIETLYNDQNMPLTEKTFDADGNQTSLVKTEYDNQGRELSERTYEDGRLTYESIQHYGSDGTFQGYTSIFYSSDGSKRVYEYDENYNHLSSKEYDANGRLVS